MSKGPQEFLLLGTAATEIMTTKEFLFTPTRIRHRTITRPVLTTKQPGRNTPCLCGSGKKYKRCCINK